MHHLSPKLGVVFIGSILSVTAALQERASFSGDPYIVSQLSSATHYGTIGSTDPSITRLRHRRQVTEEPYFHQLSFTVYNPDPLTNTKTSCSAEWSVGEPVPTSVRCEDTAFAFSVVDWVGVEKFTLDVRHTFQDPSVGQPPQDYVTLYGKEVLSLECVNGSQPKEQYCGLSTDSVELPIYAAIA